VDLLVGEDGNGNSKNNSRSLRDDNQKGNGNSNDDC
jgi:hypothetical protein